MTYDELWKITNGWAPKCTTVSDWGFRVSLYALSIFNLMYLHQIEKEDNEISKEKDCSEVY